MSDPRQELVARIDELNPHQRALSKVLSLWTQAAIPASVLGALALATAGSVSGPVADGTIFAFVYCAVAMPSAAGAWFFQERALRWIARRVIAQLDDPARAAVSGRASPAGFLAVGALSADRTKK